MSRQSLSRPYQLFEMYRIAGEICLLLARIEHCGLYLDANSIHALGLYDSHRLRSGEEPENCLCGVQVLGV